MTDLNAPQSGPGQPIQGEEAHATRIVAEMAATVWEVRVAVGQAVEEGDTVLVLESMKMEIPVVTERAGTVWEITVSEGDNVANGQHLVTVGPVSDPTDRA